eukprot:gene254-128_t
MGIFGKTRTGTMRNIPETQRFEWTIPNICTFANGTTLDSELASDWKGTRFHFHLSFVSGTGDVGFYLHYKQPPIPKYSYYLRNHKGEVMRQQTAHSIPDDTERCGHWNVCTRQDLLEFVAGGPDTLTIVFAFDDDQIVLLAAQGPAIPRVVSQTLPPTASPETGMPGLDGATVVEAIWKIPFFTQKCLWPFTSEGFVVGNNHLVARIDVRRKSTTASIASYDYHDIEAMILFLFTRKGESPSYAIELLSEEEVEKLGTTASGSDTDPAVAYAAVGPKEPGMAQALLVERGVVDRHLQQGLSCATLFRDHPDARGRRSNTPNNLYVRFSIVQPGNPLDFLHSSSTQQQQAEARPTRYGPPNTGGKGKKKDRYIQRLCQDHGEGEKGVLPSAIALSPYIYIYISFPSNQASLGSFGVRAPNAATEVLRDYYYYYLYSMHSIPIPEFLFIFSSFAFFYIMIIFSLTSLYPSPVASFFIFIVFLKEMADDAFLEDGGPTAAAHAHLLDLLEALEASREDLGRALAAAGLQLTSARWACEQRGASCDVTAIPVQPNTLRPLVALQLHDGNDRTAVDPPPPTVVGPSSCSPPPSSTSSCCSSVPWFSCAMEDGYQPPARRRAAAKATSRSAASVGEETGTTQKEGVSGPLPKDPVQYVCHPPPPALLACRDAYRGALQAILKVVNAQQFVLHWAEAVPLCSQKGSDMCVTHSNECESLVPCSWFYFCQLLFTYRRRHVWASLLLRSWRLPPPLSLKREDRAGLIRPFCCALFKPIHTENFNYY